VHPGRELSTSYFLFSVGPGVDPTNSMLDMLHEIFVLASGEIYGSRSALLCFRGVKYRCNIFIPGWAQRGYHKKHARTQYAELVFLHALGSSGDVVHYGASEARNINAIFSCSGGPGSDHTKDTAGHVMLNLWFCIRWDLRVT
jgi:hypothetical protein